MFEIKWQASSGIGNIYIFSLCTFGHIVIATDTFSKIFNFKYLKPAWDVKSENPLSRNPNYSTQFDTLDLEPYKWLTILCRLWKNVLFAVKVHTVILGSVQCCFVMALAKAIICFRANNISWSKTVATFWWFE